jgi:hypothetical protein
MKNFICLNCPSFRGNRHVLQQTHSNECTVKCSVSFVSPKLFRLSVSVSECGHTAVIQWHYYFQVWRSCSVPFNSVMAVSSTSCIKIIHTVDISCTTSRFIQGLLRPEPSIRVFKDHTDTNNTALCQVLDRVQWWIFTEVTRNKTDSYFERDCTLFTYKWYNMGLEVTWRCYS